MGAGFDGFDEFDIATAESHIHGRRGGSGPPLLLLHGIPETHLMWRRVAPILARHHTVVATDLTGYGDSGAPPSAPDHAPYSMRRLAQEQLDVMQQLGFQRFFVAGHDRGARCAYRMALDHPHAVERLAVLDIVPTGDAFDRADMAFSLGFWVWSFLAAPYPVPEELIAANPAVLVDHMLQTWSDDPAAFPAEVRNEYVAKLSRPSAIHAVCEQYRAAATVDVEHDRADRGTRGIAWPLLVLWSDSGPLASWYDPLQLWRQWATDVEGWPVRSGHFIPEEAPAVTAAALLRFLHRA
ncbi:MAG: alpha/beta hydrolase [Actinomycetota bacterium]|nr:MAG: alpha/beta hydrolase [Actinomycetota bacterium]